MNHTLTDIDVTLMEKFLKDKENTPKIMVGGRIFYPFTTDKTDIVTYKNYLISRDKFEYKHYNQPYLHCRIFTVENVKLALDMQEKADNVFIFRFEENILEKYSVIEQELFILYSNPNILYIIKHLALFEFINGKEENEKMKIIFDEYERFLKYNAKNEITG